MCEVDKVITTSNFGANVGLHNDATGDVVNFVFKNEEGPISGNIPEAVLYNF